MSIAEEVNLTAEDKEYLRQITVSVQANPDVVPGLVKAYYRDLERAERTPRVVLIFHIGVLIGMTESLLEILRRMGR